MKGKSIASIVSMLILSFFFVGLTVNEIRAELNGEYSATSNKEWQSLYPFENSHKRDEKDTFLKKIESSRYYTLSNTIKAKVNLIADKEIPLKEPVFWIYGKINKLMGVKVVRDSEYTTIDLGDGYLSFLNTEQGEYSEAVNNLIEFKKFLDEKNIPLIYMQAPYKIRESDSNVLGEIKDFNDARLSGVCEGLIEQGIDVLDLRQYMPESKGEYLDMFYKTDHHWKPQTGLWACKILGEKLNSEYGFTVDLQKYNLENYSIELVKQNFLGSQGKKFTAGYCDLEDFEVVMPKFKTNLKVIMPVENIDSTGDFGLLIDRAALYEKELYERNSYCAYTYGNQPLLQIENLDNESGEKVLFVADSFGDVVVPFVALGCARADMIDLRSFSGSLHTYIDRNEYDMVVVLRTTSGNLTNMNYTSHQEGWDFR